MKRKVPTYTEIRGKLLFDPVILDQEVLFLCQTEKSRVICVSAPGHRSLDVLFLREGVSILARGRPEGLIVDGIRLSAFRIQKIRLIGKKICKQEEKRDGSRL